MPRVIRQPLVVQRVLAELRPMAAVGPVSLREVREVLSDRLRTVAVEPPPSRYGRVFVGTADEARGRVFRIVFVPGLAERVFPQKLREDPLLADAVRREVSGAPEDHEPTARRTSGCCCTSRSARRPSACTCRIRASSCARHVRGCRPSTAST